MENVERCAPHTLVHSIIYQRGIYPPEMFKPTVAYGITVMVASDPGLVEYMSKVMAQMKGAVLVCLPLRALAVHTLAPQQTGCFTRTCKSWFWWWLASRVGK